MPWNWELPEWPHFYYDSELIAPLEKQFLIKTGCSLAFLKSIDEIERKQLIVEILTTEGTESSKIEGEILDRKSLQSSIKRHFGLQTDLLKQQSSKEAGMGDLLCSVYELFEQPLTHEMLFQWHALLFKEGGSYRSHQEPMQIISSRYGSTKVFFEAPPSKKVLSEMNLFINWFNQSKGITPLTWQSSNGTCVF